MHRFGLPGLRRRYRLGEGVSRVRVLAKNRCLELNKITMLNYVIATASVSVPSKEGAQFTVESRRSWTADNPARSQEIFVKASGKLRHRSQEWDETWSFLIAQADIQKLNEAYRLIEERIYVRAPNNERRRKEMFVDINAWLRVGWVDENGVFFGYVRVIKGDDFMEARFENYPTMAAFRDAVSQADRA